MKTNKKIGLALGSGSARGLAHIGVLKYFQENQIPIHAIAGTSMGAFIGAIYAAGISIDQMIEIANNTDWKLTAKMMMPSFTKSGFVDGNRIRDFIRTIVGDLNISDLKIPFAAVATDIVTGEEIIIQQGSLIDAVRASISMPAIFTPFHYRDRFLVDGGLVNPVPVNVARKMGVNVVIAVNVSPPILSKSKKINLNYEPEHKFERRIINSKILNSYLAKYIQEKMDGMGLKGKLFDKSADNSKKRKKTSAPSVLTTILQTIHIMENEVLRLRLQESLPDVLIEPEVDFVTLLEFHRAMELIWAGEVAAEEKIASLKRIVK